MSFFYMAVSSNEREGCNEEEELGAEWVAWILWWVWRLSDGTAPPTRARLGNNLWCQRKETYQQKQIIIRSKPTTRESRQKAETIRTDKATWQFHSRMHTRTTKQKRISTNGSVGSGEEILGTRARHRSLLEDEDSGRAKDQDNPSEWNGKAF
jgi:hypothetical protein